jgi:hypothetical protein
MLIWILGDFSRPHLFTPLAGDLKQVTFELSDRFWQNRKCIARSPDQSRTLDESVIFVQSVKTFNQMQILYNFSQASSTGNFMCHTKIFTLSYIVLCSRDRAFI